MENQQLPQVITDDVKESINNMLKEMTSSMFRIDAEKELQKDITERAKEELGIPKNLFKKLAKLAYAQDLAQEIQQTEEFFQFAQAVLENKSEA